MVKPVYDPRKNQRLLDTRVDELRARLHNLDPNVLASRTDSSYEASGVGEGIYRIPFFGREIKLSYPEYQAFDAQSGEVENVANQAMMLYHFVTSDGAPLAEEWISFSELPDGRFYNQALC